MNQRIDYSKASPEGYKVFGGVFGYVQNSGLPKVLIDLVYLRVSQINGCAYCIDMLSPARAIPAIYWVAASSAARARVTGTEPCTPVARSTPVAS